jgi:hypothetical protein
LRVFQLQSQTASVFVAIPFVGVGLSRLAVAFPVLSAGGFAGMQLVAKQY